MYGEFDFPRGLKPSVFVVCSSTPEGVPFKALVVNDFFAGCWGLL